MDSQRGVIQSRCRNVLVYRQPEDRARLPHSDAAERWDGTCGGRTACLCGAHIDCRTVQSRDRNFFVHRQHERGAQRAGSDVAEQRPITPERSRLSPGETEHFVAKGKFRDGTTQQLASVIWTSSNARVAQISNDASNRGVGLAIEPGTVFIMATAGHVRGWALLTVRHDRRE